MCARTYTRTPALSREDPKHQHLLIVLDWPMLTKSLVSVGVVETKIEQEPCL